MLLDISCLDIPMTWLGLATLTSFSRSALLRTSAFAGEGGCVLLFVLLLSLLLLFFSLGRSSKDFLFDFLDICLCFLTHPPK